jgi:hypothetical protein
MQGRSAHAGTLRLARGQLALGMRRHSTCAGSISFGHVEAFSSCGRLGSVPREGAWSRSVQSRAGGHERPRSRVEVHVGRLARSVRELAGPVDRPMNPSSRVMNSVCVYIYMLLDFNLNDFVSPLFLNH